MKGIMKKVTAIFMAMVMVVSCMVVTGTTAEADGYTVNPAEYDIEYLLSNYQVYVKEDLTTTQQGHQVGSLVVGKDATLVNSFGDASIASSYLYNIKAFLSTNPFYSSVFSKPEYAGCENSRVYYTNKADNIYLHDSPKTFVQIDSYINFTDAFSSIQTESTLKANNGSEVQVVDGYIVLDMSVAGEKHTYTITEEQLKAAKAIRLKGTDGKSDVFRDLNNPLVISFEGCGNNDVTLKFDGSEGTVGEYSIGIQVDVDADAAADNYQGLINDYSFKKWSDSQEGGQVNPAGTRVIYNFPNATGTINTAYLAGHLVAPNADVSITGGNYEGGVIAKSAYLDAEGHFYPYYEIGTASSEAPKTPSLSGKDFLITVDDAKTATEETVVDLAEGLYYETTGAEGKAEDVAVDNLSDLNKVTEPGKVTITLTDGTDETVKAASVDVTATVVDEKASNTQWDGTKQAVYQLGANDFEMSIAQVQAFLNNASGTAESTLVKTLASATALKDGELDNIANINIQDYSQVKAEKGTYPVTFSYNNNQVKVNLTVKDDGPTDDESDKTTVPSVNLTANNFTVKGGSETLTPATFSAKDKADVVAKNFDGSSRNDIVIDATDLAALNEKIKNAEEGQFPVKVYSGGETTTVIVTVDTKHPYIAADDFIIGVDEVEETTPDSIKELSDAKKIQSETDTTGDDTKVTVDSTDATELKNQTEPGLVQIAINDTSSDDDKAETRVVIATVVDVTDETDDTAANDLKIGANHFNISMEQAQAVVDAKNGSSTDKEAADAMVKILANAVATADGDAVSRDDITVDASKIQAADGSYDVTFTYTEGTDTVSVTVKATVKDNGPTDDDGDASNGEEDPTAVPSINLTANDFTVEGGSGAISAETFKTDDYAKVEANYNEGPSISDDEVIVDATDLAALNAKIDGNVPGDYDVDVTVNGVTTTVTVTVTEKYPKLDANDFIISVDDAKTADDEKVKDLSDTNRYTSDDKETAGTSEGEGSVTVPDITDLTGMKEPGSVDLTLEDGNTDKADSQEVTATVVDETTTQTVGGKEIVIGANNYNISMEQAKAIVEALADASAKPDKAATDEMNKILANAVATEAGEAVDFDQITVDASEIRAENGSYDVTFTYNTVSVTVKATVKDAGSTDHYDDPTAVPSVNLTADDFTVAGGSDALDDAAFIEKAVVIAKNNDGSSRTDIEIDDTDLAALNEKIANSEAGKYDVDVTSGGVITTVTVTVTDNSGYPKVEANDFIISVDDAKKLDDESDANAVDSIKDLSDTKRYETLVDEGTNKETGTADVTISADDIDKIAGVTEPGSVDVTLVDGNTTNPAEPTTVTATVVDKTATSPDETVVIGANHYNMSIEQAQAVVDALVNPSGTPNKTAADTMNKILANAVATDDGAAVNRNNITVDASNIKAENGTYDVTFTYGTGADAVSVTVQATVKDAGTTDGEADVTDVPNVNLTADDFTVAAGSDPIDEDEFKEAARANVEANNQDGSSIPAEDIDVNDDDLDKLNDKIAAGEADTADVRVTVEDPATGDVIETVVTVTITEKYPKIDADDFIVEVSETEDGFGADEVKDASNTTLIKDSTGTTEAPTNIDPDADAISALDKRDEPGTVPVTLTDSTGKANDTTVTATVVDVKDTDTVNGAEIVIGANDFNVTIEQAEAIENNPTSEDVKTMVKTLANAVATDDGEMVDQDDIDIDDVTVIKAENGDYDVTFTYTKDSTTVSATVTATVKDAGAGDGNADQTDVPDVNVTGNDFVVKVGDPEITPDDFIDDPDMADVDANYNDGSSVPEDKITVDQDDLDKLNDAIKNGETGPVDVKVTADGETTTITVTVADEKTVDEDNDEVIAANDFEIKLSDYDTVVPSEDELIERAGALAYDATTRADVEITEATVKDPEKKAGEYEVTFKTAEGSEVTVTMTIDTTPSITANDFNISMEQAATIVAGKTNEDVKDMVKELANAVAKEDTTVQPDSEVAVDASKVKAAKGSYDVTFTYGTGADAVSVTVKATVKDNSAADGDADKTDVPDVNLTANDFTVAAGSDPLTDKTFNDKADTVAKKNDGTPVTDVKVNADDLAKLNDAITNGKAGDYKVKVTSGNDTVTVTVTVTKGDDIKGVDQIYEISNPKDVPQDLADGRTVKTVNVNGKDIPASAYTVKDGKMDINKSVFKDMKEGTYPVVITYTDGSKHTFNVKVIPYDETTVVKKVPTFHMQKDLGVGKTFKLNLVGMNKTAVKKFKTSNKRIATINKNGVIKGKKKGKCKITATVIQNGSYYTVKIDLHVKKSMKMYNLKKKALQKKEGVLPEFNVYKRVVKGKTTKLKFTNVEKDAKITYKSSNKKVASISKKGVIKGKKKGFAVVTAKIEQNGFTYYTKLIVRVDDGTKNKQLKKYLK